MMLPLRCAVITRPADCTTLKLPFKLSVTTRSKSSSVYCRIGLRTLILGVQTTTSRRP